MSSSWQAESFDTSVHIPSSVQCTEDNALKHLLSGGVVCNCSDANLARWVAANKAAVGERELHRYTDWRQGQSWACVVLQSVIDEERANCK